MSRCCRSERFCSRIREELSAPTLLLVGEISPVELTAPAMALSDALPDSRVHILPGQGHVAMTTAPELFLDAIAEFLSP